MTTETKRRRTAPAIDYELSDAPDWAAIQHDYEYGVDDVATIARRHRVLHWKISKRAHLWGWGRLAAQQARVRNMQSAFIKMVDEIGRRARGHIARSQIQGADGISTFKEMVGLAERLDALNECCARKVERLKAGENDDEADPFVEDRLAQRVRRLVEAGEDDEGDEPSRT